jgi:hypothetical protein
MRIKKEKVKLKKIKIDLVRCPMTDLYLQDLYCKKCGNFISSDLNFIECKYKNVAYAKSKPKSTSNVKNSKELLLKELNQSKSEKNLPKKSSINQIPQSNENFSQRILSKKINKQNNSTQEQSIIQELTQKLKKDTLTENFNR